MFAQTTLAILPAVVFLPTILIFATMATPAPILIHAAEAVVRVRR